MYRSRDCSLGNASESRAPRGGDLVDLTGRYTNTRITAFNGCTYSTDADGNVTSRVCGTTTTTLVWSAEGTLDSLRVAVSGGATTGVKFGYDASGRLVLRRVNGTPQSYLLWDGNDLAAELGGTATTTSAEYAYLGADQPYATGVGTQVYFAQTDPLGNVVALTDTAKVAQRTYVYDDWGRLIGGADPAGFSSKDRVRWKGALWLGPEAELYYMRARWYEAGTGRFLSEDPVGLAGGVNPYVYAGSEPVNGSDPSGTCASNEVLWVRFVREADGGITVLGYFCRTAGGGNGGAGPSGPASGQTRQACSAQTTESQALFGGSFLVGGPRVPSGVIGGGLNVGLTSSGRVFIQLTGSVSGGVGAYVGTGSVSVVGDQTSRLRDGAPVVAGLEWRTRGFLNP